MLDLHFVPVVQIVKFRRHFRFCDPRNILNILEFGVKIQRILHHKPPFIHLPYGISLHFPSYHKAISKNQPA